jgi:hypothetical protein
MVVAATDFYKALSDPLQAIQDLFGTLSRAWLTEANLSPRARNQFADRNFTSAEKKGDQANFSSLVASHFNDLFRENDSRAKVRRECC